MYINLIKKFKETLHFLCLPLESALKDTGGDSEVI